MKARLRNVTDRGVRYQALMFWCPGCENEHGQGGMHMLPVNTTDKSPSWGFNGDMERPTLTPSILTRYGRGQVCHSFLVDGVFQFLGDCTHRFAGQNVPMPDLPDWAARWW